MTKPILCLDFDGVIHSYTSGWKGIDVVADPPVPGVFEFLEEAVKVFHVCILSSRSHQEGGVKAMKDWFYRHAQEYLKYQEDNSWILEIEFVYEKPAAFLIIDDRAMTFTGKWPVVADLLKFKPWYK